MPRANKTSRINTRGYYPPRGMYESMEPHEEEDPRSKKLTCQHLHLRLSHSRKSLKKKNLKRWRSLYCLMMMMMRTPFKKINLPLPWDGLQRSGISRGVNPPFRTIDLWGFFRPTTLIGKQLWSMSTKNICTLWRTLIRTLGHASPSGMKRRKHISWTQAIRIMLVVPPWKMA